PDRPDEQPRLQTRQNSAARGPLAQCVPSDVSFTLPAADRRCISWHRFDLRTTSREDAVDPGKKRRLLGFWHQRCGDAVAHERRNLVALEAERLRADAVVRLHITA